MNSGSTVLQRDREKNGEENGNGCNPELETAKEDILEECRQLIVEVLRKERER